MTRSRRPEPRQLDPFINMFLERLKKKIENDRDLVSRLQAYAGIQRPLKKDQPIAGFQFLGSGDIHTHYQFGKVGRLYVATRESMIYQEPELQRLNTEVYISSVRAHRESGDLVPLAVGGVHCSNPERYFLLVEDLTRGGEREVLGHGTESETGTVRKKGSNHGWIVHFDFRLNASDEYMAQIHDYRYMADGKMIEI